MVIFVAQCCLKMFWIAPKVPITTVIELVFFCHSLSIPICKYLLFCYFSSYFPSTLLSPSIVILMILTYFSFFPTTVIFGVLCERCLSLVGNPYFGIFFSTIFYFIFVAAGFWLQVVCVFFFLNKCSNVSLLLTCQAFVISAIFLLQLICWFRFIWFLVEMTLAVCCYFSTFVFIAFVHNACSCATIIRNSVNFFSLPFLSHCQVLVMIIFSVLSHKYCSCSGLFSHFFHSECNPIPV